MASTQQSLFPHPAEDRPSPGARQAREAVPEPAPRRPRPTRLWLAVELPQLALDMRRRVQPHAMAPQAIIETRGNQASIHSRDEQAAVAGVQAGLSLAAAWALCPALEIHEVEPRREAVMRRRLAAWCGQFTPLVVLDDACLLLEIRGSLQLFGGARRLERILRDGLAELGFHARTAIAPTPRAASWFAASGGGQCVQKLERLPAELASLPLACTGFSDRLLARFAGIGARHVGDLVRLPRDGFARRFGAGTLAILDQALGRAPDVREPLQPPPQFRADLDLNYEIEAAPVLLHPTRILLREFAGYLLATQQGVLRWRLELTDRDKGITRVDLGHGEATREFSRMERLLEQKLEKVQLSAPVQHIRLQALRMETASGRVQGLFRDSAEASRWDELVECLRARLGDEAVESLAALPDHRPELAVRSGEPGEVVPAESVAARRPLWLLPQPEALAAGQEGPRGMALLEGPERIESGWWDGADVRRDYWRARDRDGRLCWIFRNQRSDNWFLHGYFN
ncbi:MAG: DNA polymerase Y family protein [Gammaproteobacteria bacterium]|nr:DNA polymerase Y family protein [Gammaproteobacteria bacterium]